MVCRNLVTPITTVRSEGHIKIEAIGNTAMLCNGSSKIRWNFSHNRSEGLNLIGRQIDHFFWLGIPPFTRANNTPVTNIPNI